MFSTIKAIRNEGGFQYEERSVDVYDINRDNPVVGDGTETEFYTKHIPIIDRDGDDEVTIADVVVYVNGTVVDIDTVDADQGLITLTDPPANNDIITVSYAWSSIDDSLISLYQQGAYGEIVSSLSRVYVMDVADVAINANFTSSPAQYFLESVERILAAGRLLQIIFTDENDGMNKQGVMKEATALKMLSGINKNTIILLDSEYNELLKYGVFNPSGYPDTTEPADQESKFTIEQQL